MAVVNWFWRKRPKSARIDAPRLRPRSENAATATRVDLADLAPHRDQYLAQAAYVQLVIFEGLSANVVAAPTLAAKEALSRAAAIALDKHHKLATEIRRTGAEPSEAMEPYASHIEFFQKVTLGSTWEDSLVTSHITAGILDDFFTRVAAGLPEDLEKRVLAIYASASHDDLVSDQLRTVIESNPGIAAHLAMWGRRLVGDTLLVARHSLASPPSSATDEARIEPVFTELIAAHTRRMDALGLTA